MKATMSYSKTRTAEEEATNTYAQKQQLLYGSCKVYLHINAFLCSLNTVTLLPS